MEKEDPLSLVRRINPTLRAGLENNQSHAYADGKLPAKVKLLIAMTLDAIHNSPEGVRVLAEEAIRHGATWDEIGEVLEVIYYNCGAIPLYTIAAALRPLLDESI